VVADEEFVIVLGRYAGLGQPANWIVTDIVRVKDGLLTEHWEVIQDEATEAELKSGLPPFSSEFPRRV
jgi:predicted SnoaL-like aldol condensation-catalyzing enzyme